MPVSPLPITAAQRPGFRVCVDFGAGRNVVVGVSGELDVVTAPQLGGILGVLVEQAGTEIVLDLSDLEFMDASGLRVIAMATTQLRPTGRRLTLRSVPAMARRILAVTGVGDFVDIDSSAKGVVTLGPGRRSADRSRVVTRQSADRVDLAAVGTVAADDDVIDRALHLVATLAKATIGGADGASVSLDRHGELMTVAATDETITQMDHDQYATAQGPCVDAAAEGRWFHVDSLATETRWPDFVPLAILGGIGSILSNPLLVGGRPVGALNIYSTAEAAFGASAQDLASMFASQASGILASAGIEVTVEEPGRRLRDALLRREVIAQAHGVLMERTGLGLEEAADALRRSALYAQASVHDRAIDLVTSTRRGTLADL